MTENHFRSHFSPFQINTQLFLLIFTKWPPASILDDRKSLSIVFLDISDQYATFFCLNFVHKKGRWRPFWMTGNHFRSHFSPFQINTQLFCLDFFFAKWLPAAILDDENHFRSHFSPFQINTQLLFYFFHKMTADGHFG